MERRKPTKQPEIEMHPDISGRESFIRYKYPNHGAERLATKLKNEHGYVKNDETLYQAIKPYLDSRANGAAASLATEISDGVSRSFGQDTSAIKR